MFTNGNLSAPLGAMAFLGSAFLLLLAAAIFLYGLVSRRLGLSRLVLILGTVGAAVYFGTLLVFSNASRDELVARGEEKHFCEIDCHLAYSVVDVLQAKTLGNPGNQVTADGMFYVITMKTRFDENTINPTRGNGPLTPNSRVVSITDDQGRVFVPSASGEEAVSRTEGLGTPLTTPLRPGECYLSKIVFDLPTDVHHPTLLMREGEWVTHFVIGHENSPFHKKTRFQLGV